MLIVSSFIVNFALEREGVAAGLATAIRQLDLSPLGFQIVVNIAFLVLGTVLDGAVMLLVFVPVLLPASAIINVVFRAATNPEGFAVVRAVPAIPV